METDCYLDLLPPELKGHLLKFCDGNTLVALSTLSDNWNDYVVNSSKEEWWRVCLEEISVDYMLDILLSLYPKLWLENDVFWGDIFLSWTKWRNIPENFNLHKLRVYTTRYEITSVQFSGNWIVIGTREGQLTAVNINSGINLILMNGGGPIFNIERRRISDEDITSKTNKRSTPTWGQLSKLNNITSGALSGFDHDELVLRKKKFYVTYNVRNGKTSFKWEKLDDYLQLKYFGPQEIKIYNIFHCTEIKSTCTAKQKISKLTLNNIHTSVLQVWNEKVVLAFENGAIKVYDYNLNELDHTMNKLVIDHKDIINKRLIVAHLDVMFILDDGTSSNVLGKGFDVIVGNYKRNYRPLPELGAEVTSILYHAGFLFLGTADGFLYIFRLDCDEDLLSLNLGESHCHLNITDNCTSPIVALSIQEDVYSHFFIAAASNSDVYLISSNDLDDMP